MVELSPLSVLFLQESFDVSVTHSSIKLFLSESVSFHHIIHCMAVISGDRHLLQDIKNLANTSFFKSSCLINHPGPFPSPRQIFRLSSSNLQLRRFPPSPCISMQESQSPITSPSRPTGYGLNGLRPVFYQRALSRAIEFSFLPRTASFILL